MSLGAWSIVVALVVLALYGAGTVGWKLGRRSVLEDARPVSQVPRRVPVRSRADQLVDLGDLSKLLDRYDVLIVSTASQGNGIREEVVETAVLDTTSTVRLSHFSLDVGESQESPGRSWPVVYADLAKLFTDATLIISYGAALHLRMLTQTTERHGLKKLPGIDWGCLMRRYTETVTGLGGQWINLATARVREDIVSSNSVGVLEDARTALQLLQILAERQLTEQDQPGRRK